MSGFDPYKMLGLKRDATRTQVRRAYLIAAIVAAKAIARAQRLAAEAPGVAEAREAQRRERRSQRAAERYRLKKGRLLA